MRENKGSKKKKNRYAKAPKGKLLLKVLGGLIVLGVVVVLATVVMTAAKVGKINEDSLYANIERSSILYDIDGTEIDTLHYSEDRKIVPIDEMPDDLKSAFIAIEDKTFYKHHGSNFRRMFGAVLSRLTGRSSSISGTSTITQQLARNVYLAEIKSQRSISRKLSEMYIAWRLENNLTKDQILEAYLNTIYLGYGNYGVGSAARTYFSKEVSDLDLAECAALAALPQAPDSYALITEDPEGNEEIRNITYYSLNEVDEAAADEETAADDAAMDAIHAADLALRKALGKLLDSDDAADIFAERNPFSSVGGHFFCEVVLDALGEIVGEVMAEEAEASAKRTAKYIEEDGDARAAAADT